MLTPQHQQQVVLAQQNSAHPSASDESRRLGMLLNNRSMSLDKDGISNPFSDVVSNIGSPLRGGGPPFPRGDTDMLMKSQQQRQQQASGNSQQHALSNQQSLNSNHNMHQQDKVRGGSGSVTAKNLGRTTPVMLAIVIGEPKAIYLTPESHASDVGVKSHTLQLDHKSHSGWYSMSNSCRGNDQIGRKRKQPDFI